MVSFTELVEGTRQVFRSHKTRSLQWRREQLHALLRLIDDQKDRIRETLKKDLHKNKTEATFTELDISRNEVCLALNNLEKWTKPEKVTKDLPNMFYNCSIRSEPYGVVLVIGPWNYPWQLVIIPLISAIAAGNCVILKPSEMAVNTGELIAELIPQYMDKEAFKVVKGSVPETTALLKERFDYIFYTGAPPVGKIVMEAAAKHLTPVTLELGGKSPCYVDKSSDLYVAARRITWGKYANAGQTCIAPDYILCEPQIQDKLVKELKVQIQEFFGANPQTSDDYGRIINNRHFKRVQNLISNDKVSIGGVTDEGDKYISPTVMTNVVASDPVMKEEIFGPLLPIMSVKSEDEAIEFINSREKPLALYVFSQNQAVNDKFISRTSSGGLCVNDTIMHVTLDTLPFGGVGTSGMGSYHGKHGFNTFSHKRSCMIKDQKLEVLNSIRYPPYKDPRKGEWLAWLTKKELKKKGSWGMFLPLLLATVVVAILYKML